MGLFFDITTSDGQISQVAVHDGMTIGRKACDLILDDAKVSSLHAEVISRDGSLILIDQRSSNGIKIDGTRRPEVLLSPGARFKIGRTQFVVIHEDAKSRETSKPRAPLSDETGIESATAEVPVWRHDVGKLIKNILDSAEDRQTDVAAFNPPLKCLFIQGIQTGDEWILGYGPRQIGAGSLEFPLHEDATKKIGFELIPESKGPKFKSNASGTELIRLNGRVCAESSLQNGDIIEVCQTRIRIEFLTDE